MPRTTSTKRGTNASEELADPVHGGFAEHDLEEHSPTPHRDANDDDRDVLEQHAERQQHDAQCRQGVKPRERWRQERAERAPEREHPEDALAQPMFEQKAEAPP